MLTLPPPSPSPLTRSEQAKSNIRRAVSLSFPGDRRMSKHKNRNSWFLTSTTQPQTPSPSTATAIKEEQVKEESRDLPDLAVMRGSSHSLLRSNNNAGDSGDESTDGLGINFYDNEGHRKTSKKTCKVGHQEKKFEQNKDEDEKSEAKGSSNQPGTDTAAAQPPSLNIATKPLPSMSGLPTDNNDLKKDPLSIIEELLEENYRGQAAIFTRISSRASNRSTSQSTGKRSVSSPVSRNFTAPSAPFETPTRQSGNFSSFASIQRNQAIRTPSLQSAALRTPSRGTRGTPYSGNRTVLETYSVLSVSKRRHQSGFSPVEPPASPHTTYGHRIYSVPENASSLLIKKQRQCNLAETRGSLYFWDSERQDIAEAVDAKEYNCVKHKNCTDCRNQEFTYLENKAMPTSMPPEERQKIINGNRSLRNIKNELENLAENGLISDEAYDKIMSSLPAESSLNASARAAPAPSPSNAPVNDLQNMRLGNEPPPPAYNTPNPPSLPTRQATNPPPKPEIARAVALYRYAEPDDCTFEVGDNISVFEHMNNDWWLGKNLRTGKEGVFPVNYVQVQANHIPPPAPYTSPTPQGMYGNEKSQNPYGGYPGQYQPTQQGPPPPGPSNPYNSAVPPMQIAEQPTETKPGKGQEMGKKFGKKLGNAAIFGAGATMGGKIVNSIF